MRRPRPVLAWLALCILVTGLTAYPPAGPWLIRDKVPPPLRHQALQRILSADRVVVGKVRAIEREPALAAHAPRDLYLSAYRIAVVDVQETIVGPEEPSVRVGFRPVHLAEGRHLELKPGDEACFFLTRHADQPFHVVTVTVDRPALGSGRTETRTDLDIVRRAGATYERDLALVRRCRQLLAEPMKGLQAANPEDRLLTAALLVLKYRTQPAYEPGVRVTQVPIDPAESRQILRVLADADLSETAQGSVSALGVFIKLSPDSFRWSTSLSTVSGEARAWLKANADTYAIKRWSQSTAPPPEKKAGAIRTGDSTRLPPPVTSRESPSVTTPAAAEQPGPSTAPLYAAICILGGVSALMTLCTLVLLRRGKAGTTPPKAQLDSTTAP